MSGLKGGRISGLKGYRIFGRAEHENCLLRIAISPAATESENFRVECRKGWAGYPV